ncbi:MAG: PH domain-containing protein [Cyclobacteriaceae bacterium]
MIEESFDQPQRQSGLGFVIYIGRNIRAIISLLLSFFAFGALQSIALLFVGLLILLGVIVVLIFSYLQYEFFTFQIVNDELIINEGVLFRERKVIPFHRIQSVHLHQNLLQRITKLVGVKVDTAGSKGKELEIPALTRKKAETLRDLLRERSKIAEDKTTEITTEAARQEREPDSASAKSDALVKLNVWNLLVLGITENHLRSGFLAMAIVLGYFQQYSEFVKKYIEPTVEEYLPQNVENNITLIAGGIFVFLIGSIIISLLRIIFKFWDFEARLQENFIQIQSGLVKRNQYRIPKSKVQYLELHTNFIRKQLGFSNAKIFQAQSASSEASQSMEIPACFAHHEEAIKKLLFQNLLQLPKININADTIAYVRFAALMGFIPIPFLVWAAIKLSWGFIFAAVLYYVYVLYSSWRYGRTVEISLNQEIMTIRRGWLFPVRIFIPLYKAQSLAVKQNIFLKRRKLAHLIIYTASGSKRVKYLPEDIAFELANFQLAKVETHQGSWM